MMQQHERRPAPTAAPLWPKPNDEVWFRRAHEHNWSFGICVEVLAASVGVRRFGCTDVYLVFCERVDGEKSILREAPAQKLWTPTALAAMIQLGRPTTTKAVA